MTRIELAPEIADDFERIIRHLVAHDVEQPGERMQAIINAIDLLASSPEIGRPCRKNLRELITGRGARGYVTLYQYVKQVDTVYVLAVRSQLEAGYDRGTH